MKNKLLIVVAIETVLLIAFVIYAVAKSGDDNAGALTPASTEQRLGQTGGPEAKENIEKYKALAELAHKEAEMQRNLALRNEQVALASRMEAERQKVIAIENEKRAMEMMREADRQRKSAQENASAAAEKIQQLTAEIEKLKKTAQ
jgi:hypothetical protein